MRWLVVVILILITGCGTVAERMKTVPVAGQQGSIVVTDRAECDRRAHSVGDKFFREERARTSWLREGVVRRDTGNVITRAYASCMMVRGYIAELAIWPMDTIGGDRYGSSTRPAQFFVRAEQAKTEEQALADLAACEARFHERFADASFLAKMGRELLAELTFGGASIRPGRRDFIECLAGRGYAVSDEYDDPVLRAPATSR